MALFGENVQIQCRTNMGATYHWILNGTRLEADQYRVPTPLGQFTIYGLAEEDLGEYVCIAQNEAGIGASHAMVTVGGKNWIQFDAKVYSLLHVYRVLEIIQCYGRTPLSVFSSTWQAPKEYVLLLSHTVKLWV